MIHTELLPIFKTVTKHLLTQNKKSLADGTECSPRKASCLYKGPNNLSCAVGCLIKDEFYNQDMEGECVTNGEIQSALIKSGISITPEVNDLLVDLQCIHDDTAVEDWKLTLINVAVDVFDMGFNEASSLVTSLIEV